MEWKQGTSYMAPVKSRWGDSLAVSVSSLSWGRGSPWTWTRIRFSLESGEGLETVSVHYLHVRETSVCKICPLFMFESNYWVFWGPSILSVFTAGSIRDRVQLMQFLSAETCQLCSTVKSCGLSSLCLRIIHSYTLFLKLHDPFPTWLCKHIHATQRYI